MTTARRVGRRPQDIIALKRLAKGTDTATYWVAQALNGLGGHWNGNTSKARNVLRALARHGLVVGRGYRDMPPVRWWSITDAGRAILAEGAAT